MSHSQFEVSFVAPAQSDAPWLFVHPDVNDLLKYSSSEWLDRSSMWLDHVHPADRERVRARKEAARPSPEAVEIAYRLLRRDGSTIWVWDRAWATEASGEVLWHGHWLAAPISSRADDNWIDIFDGCLVEPGGKIVKAHSAVQAVVGYASAELEGRNCRDLINPGDHLDINRAIEAASATDSAKAARVGVRLRREGGSDIDLELRFMNLMDEPAVEALLVLPKVVAV